MKLVITGATGLVGTEVIRQSLSIPGITSVVALGRREVLAPSSVRPSADPSKLKSVILKSFDEDLPEDVKNQLRGVNACIWLLAITPSKSKTFPWEEVRKVNLDYTVAGMQSLMAVSEKPFRFIYTSGQMSERDQSKKLALLGDYRLLRGEAENQVLSLADKREGSTEAQIVKPGIIDGPGRGMLVRAALAATAALGGISKVHVSEIAACLLDQAINGFEKETLENADLIRIAKKNLKDDDYVK
ncbi:hypothetical protein BCR34DRAFT_600761 [Clohesyomyces aquaticus]|uniref:NAD(P)-binding domain-containing protein n=1 Tax=Clohesyomyces aquaticus TaxID=1231657 RepID=A0A1Y1ZQX3_9PLEO|nr:hypothetical protein BCR34DRAFT_600761 [Clohesyomyces aquaticus]